MASSKAEQTGKAAERASAAAGAAAEQAKDAAERAAAGAQETTRRVGEASEAAWDVARRTGTQARNLVGDAYQRGERGARELAHRVEQRPLMALLIAGAIGYAIAYLLHRRRAPA